MCRLFFNYSNFLNIIVMSFIIWYNLEMNYKLICLKVAIFMKKKVIVGSLLVVVFIAVIWVTSFSLTKSQIQNSKTTKKEEISTINTSINSLETEMHEMANSLIVAEDDQIWGNKEVNTENVKKILKESQFLKKNSSTDNNINQLLIIAQRWDKHDFSCIVDDHNFIWQKLSGNVGKAKSANQEAVNAAIDRLTNGQ